mmetsp:Transcript_3226/g.4342  ORF Transcript_3226/g.4342 Transcript_3226/m.4342 type:complete len:171 (+) Transcript_3226:36-548(+)
MIRTALTTRLGITHPIISAPMCGMAMGKLVGSVAAAGGIGLIGIGSPNFFTSERVSVEWVLAQEEIRKECSEETYDAASFCKVLEVCYSCSWAKGEGNGGHGCLLCGSCRGRWCSMWVVRGLVLGLGWGRRDCNGVTTAAMVSLSLRLWIGAEVKGWVAMQHLHAFIAGV